LTTKDAKEGENWAGQDVGLMTTEETEISFGWEVYRYTDMTPCQNRLAVVVGSAARRGP